MKLDRVIAVRNDKTVYRDGDTCVKVFGDDYSKADVISEALNLARIEETGLNIPKVREITTIDGKWVIVLEYIKGKTLQQLMDEDVANIDRYIEMFVDLQLEVHSKVNPLLVKLKDKLNIKISQSELEATVRYDLHTKLDKMPKHSKICHGDFRPSNVVITDEGKAYIIDWSHACQGNGAADAAKTYLFLRLRGDIQSAEKYLEIYCEKSTTAKEYIYRWIPIVAAAQSVVSNEKEREFFLSWLDGKNFE